MPPSRNFPSFSILSLNESVSFKTTQSSGIADIVKRPQLSELYNEFCLFEIWVCFLDLFLKQQLFILELQGAYCSKDKKANVA